MFPSVSLRNITKEDVGRVAQWLSDPEVNTYWYGLDDEGVPLHIGYSPKELAESGVDAVQELVEADDRRIYSVYTSEGDHIGEGQLVIEWSLLEAQLFMMIGRKDLWHHHYGTAALIELLDQAFSTYELHRVWVDIPEYNEHALELFRHVGFVLEGHFRRAHRKDNEWYDSLAMGLLVDEYARRRARLTGSGTG